MKWYVKIAIAFMILIVIASIVVLSWLKVFNSQVQTAQTRERSGNIFDALSAEETAPAQERYTFYTPQNPHSELLAGHNDITGAIYRTGTAIVKSLLAPDAVVDPSGKLLLINDHTAELTGKAAIPGNALEAEKLFEFKVKVYFFPDGSTEAAFPEFTPLKAQ
jgi:type II secretory pathway pseudopilin PulG